MRKTWAIAATAFLAAFGGAVWLAWAAVTATCPGNVCANTVTIGGRDVQYQWTQNHDATTSSLKIRFRAGPYAAGAGTVRFKVYVSKPFAGAAVLKNPDPATTLPPLQSVDMANLWVERSIVAPSAGTVVDFVQELKYESPAPGQIDLTVELAQYGQALTITPTDVPLQRLELDATAPSNRDEGEDFPQPPYAPGYKTCGDGIDNDLDYRLDCADANCLGKTIRTTPTSTCEAPEASCNDGLDNDGDGRIDCADPDCNGKPGNTAGDKFCGAENGGTGHANCADGFDNDGNGKIDCTDDTAGTGCWKTGYQDCAVAETSCTDNIDNDRDADYSENRDADPASGIDCRDYDCKGQGHCPSSERLRWDAGSGTFVDAPAQCADGSDNDLDGRKDCADDDCLAYAGCARYEAWMPPNPLGDGSAGSNPSYYFNYCSDGFDNDGNGQVDGADPACRNKFGECGPAGAVGLAATEDISFLSCTDGLDNDLNGQIDCADAQCRAGRKLGRRGCLSGACGGKVNYTDTDAAVCAANENEPRYCGDGVDNNANGQVDCADPGCLGVRHGPAVFPGYVCGAETGANCSDGYDNDGNGKTDCLDPGCQNGIQCAQRNWTVAAECVEVPHQTALAPIVAGGSVQYAHLDRLHVNDGYRIRFTGSGAYTSLTLVVGDALVPANAFPFNAVTCSLSGSGAGSMSYAATDARVGVIALKSGAALPGGFDVTLTCAGSASVIGPPPDSYTLAVVANRGGTVEYGEAQPTVQVYENVPPVLSPTVPAPTPGPAVDVEGLVGGKVNVPVGGTVRFQAKPGDPAPSSGICQCAFDLGGQYAVSGGGDCLTSRTFANDAPAFSVSASALDGASNRSATSTPQTVNINVVPSVASNLVVTSSAATYRGGSALNFSAAFQTDTLNVFPGPCRLYVYDDAFSGAEASTVTWAPAGVGTNLMTCSGSYAVPAALAGGRYFLVVETTDSSGDVVRSNIQAMLKCEPSDVGTGECKDADFDADGVPEGRYTPDGFPAAPDYPPPGANSSCDNCLNFANPDQRDSNANGVGDACEASLIGRCRYKYCGDSPTDPTPGGPCLDDAGCTGGDRCVVVEQAMCSVNCAGDSECSPPTAPISGGSCIMDWGICKGGANDGACCFSDADCDSQECDFLVKPFVQALNGQVYATGGVVQGRDTPPVANATYCVASGGAIINFTSQYGCSLPNVPGAQAPAPVNNYRGTFGIIDVNGIQNGKYGAVEPGSVIPGVLDGRIILFNPGTPVGLAVTSPITFMNGSASGRGNGLIVVKGDLEIKADTGYEGMSVSDLRRLASVGWIVLKGSACSGETGPGCGNVRIDPAVRNFVGAVFAEGTIDTGFGTTQLNVAGALVAKGYVFGREFASRTQGAERVTFDPRLMLNPPPGLTDAARSLPGFKPVPAQ